MVSAATGPCLTVDGVTTGTIYLVLVHGGFIPFSLPSI